MKILVTGGGGYLGSVLIPKLLLRGHQVRVLDKGYFGLDHLRSLQPAIELIRDDLSRIRSDGRFSQELLDGCDCIIHLAAISNDPSSELDPDLTAAINFHATLTLAERARARRIRFLFSSSCSVYGESTEELCEESKVQPLTVYALSKINAEQGIDALADQSWSPIILRNGTLFGYSPRMRFDLVINMFSLYSTLYNEINIFNDGKQWRPFLHVSDCARAFTFFSEQQELEHRCYNIAHENKRVIDLITLFQRANPHLRVNYLDLQHEDRRDYRVATARMRASGFEPRVGIAQGIDEINEALVQGLIPNPESVFYHNAKWLRKLIDAGDDLVDTLLLHAKHKALDPSVTKPKGILNERLQELF